MLTTLPVLLVNQHWRQSSIGCSEMLWTPRKHVKAPKETEKQKSLGQKGLHKHTVWMHVSVKCICVIAFITLKNWLKSKYKPSSSNCCLFGCKAAGKPCGWNGKGFDFVVSGSNLAMGAFEFGRSRQTLKAFWHCGVTIWWEIKCWKIQRKWGLAPAF